MQELLNTLFGKDVLDFDLEKKWWGSRLRDANRYKWKRHYS